jgi:GNAT superfamily N-acetyltransferase
MARTPYRIYQVDPSHADVRRELDRMHLACFPNFEPVQPFGDWWFAYKNGSNEAVGFAGLWPSQRVEGAGYLSRAGVMPIARGAGLQCRLIKAREKQARAKGWTVLFSDTFPGNAHSLNNLFACGFRCFVPKEPWCGGEWIYLKKVIDTGVA